MHQKEKRKFLIVSLKILIWYYQLKLIGNLPNLGILPLKHPRKTLEKETSVSQMIKQKIIKIIENLKLQCLICMTPKDYM